jgi:hypothetical protein
MEAVVLLECPKSFGTDASKTELMLEQTLQMLKTCRAVVYALVFHVDMLRLSLHTSSRRSHVVLLSLPDLVTNRYRRQCMSALYRSVQAAVGTCASA